MGFKLSILNQDALYSVDLDPESGMYEVTYNTVARLQGSWEIIYLGYGDPLSPGSPGGYDDIVDRNLYSSDFGGQTDMNLCYFSDFVFLAPLSDDCKLEMLVPENVISVSSWAVKGAEYTPYQTPEE